MPDISHRAVGQVDPVVGDQPQHLCEAQGDDHEERPTQPQRDGADDEAEHRRHERRGKHRDMKRHGEAAREQRRGIGADAKERGVAERELADIADDEVEARRQHHRERDQYADVKGVLIRDQNRRQQRGGQYTQQAITLEGHQARSVCLPKRP